VAFCFVIVVDISNKSAILRYLMQPCSISCISFAENIPTISLFSLMLRLSLMLTLIRSLYLSHLSSEMATSMAPVLDRWVSWASDSYGDTMYFTPERGRERVEGRDDFKMGEIKAHSNQ
jgi:hypothetical protein